MNARRDAEFTRTFNVLFRQDTQNFNRGIDQNGQAVIIALGKHFFFFLALEGMRHEEAQAHADLGICRFILCSMFSEGICVRF